MTFFLLIALICGSVSSSDSHFVVDHYKIRGEILPESGCIKAQAVVRVRASADGVDNFQFILNKDLDIESLRADVGLEFRFDKSSVGIYRYAPVGSPVEITLERSLQKGESIDIEFDYGGKLAESEWGVNMLTPEWIEIGMYSAWYPLVPEQTDFTYDVVVKLDPAYAVSGTGRVRRSAEYAELIGETPTTSIVFVASKALKTMDFRKGNLFFRLDYVSITDEQANRIANDAAGVIDVFSGWFGSQPGGNLTIVLSPREKGGGYARPGFLSIIYDGKPDEYLGFLKSCAHEISHLWWNGAPMTTWEDWINESFAEYSALMLIRKWYGDSVFREFFDQYEKDSEGAPAIWNIDRNDSEKAYMALYIKGPVILHRLENTVGKEEFLRLLAALVEGNVKSTDALLQTLENMTSKEVRREFEDSLKR